MTASAKRSEPFGAHSRLRSKTFPPLAVRRPTLADVAARLARSDDTHSFLDRSPAGLDVSRIPRVAPAALVLALAGRRAAEMEADAGDGCCRLIVHPAGEAGAAFS